MHYKSMNIKTNVINVNQCDENKYIKLEEKEFNVEVFNSNQRGVGKSRNLALINAWDDILIMADDDEVFVDNYESIILNEFKNNPDADMIIFNVRVHNKSKIKNTTTKNGRVRFFNALRYGTVTFAFKRDKIHKNAIFFSLLFGGGAKYGSGEDSLFLMNVLNKKLKVYSVTQTIADVYNEDSTWFKGYNEKFYFDKGALFAAISRKYFFFYIIQFWLRRYNNQSSISRIKALKSLFKGAADYKKS